jgi:D-alanine-D-alanine ligase
MEKRKARNDTSEELPKKVGILHSDVRREYFPTEMQYITEKDAEHDAGVIARYLEKVVVEVKLYPGNGELALRLYHDRPDMVINLVDSVKGVEKQAANIPGVMELLDLPYTGAGTLALSMDYNKYMVIKLLQCHGIPVPNSQLIVKPADYLDPSLRFPLISKLNSIHGAVEINQDAISENEKHLRKRLNYLIKTYKTEVLVQEYIAGREITAMVFEGANKKVYMGEKVFNKPGEKFLFATFDDQWTEKGDDAFRYEKYEDHNLRELTKKAFEVIQMYDYGKFDVRCDQAGRYYFIDSNCNPAFGPKELDVAISNILGMYGIEFTEILHRLLLNTMRDATGQERIPFVLEPEMVNGS